MILDGLYEEYDPLVASILSRSDPYSISEIEALLMALEQRLEKNKKQTSDAFSMQQMQANLVQNHIGGGRGRSQNWNPRGGYRGRVDRPSYRGGGGRHNFNKPQCEVFKKYGPIALKCYC